MIWAFGRYSPLDRAKAEKEIEQNCKKRGIEEKYKSNKSSKIEIYTLCPLYDIVLAN